MLPRGRDPRRSTCHRSVGGETGLLVDVAVGLLYAARVHDVGTGSGAVALAIKNARPDRSSLAPMSRRAL